MAAGQLVSLSNGRAGRDLEEDLCRMAGETPALAVGLDFAFSFPEWFLAWLGVANAVELWEWAEREGESWLARCQAPLWGRPGCPRPDLGQRSHFRMTDLAVPATGPGRVRPKSPFQIGGAGSVGSGSIRGIATLSRLRGQGFRIWPFDADGWPRLLEIYPRLLTGAVAKSNQAARSAYLAVLAWPPDEASRDQVASTEDAFDAALSARALDAHQPALLSPPSNLPAQAAREGWIWCPPTVLVVLPIITSV
ncbi:MAG: hypothetical protein NVSMB32_02130 [Actinomycetota bacterium]